MQVPCCRCDQTMSLAYALREGRYTCQFCDHDLYGTGVKRKIARRKYMRNAAKEVSDGDAGMPVLRPKT